MSSHSHMRDVSPYLHRLNVTLYLYKGPYFVSILDFAYGCIRPGSSLSET